MIEKLTIPEIRIELSAIASDLASRGLRKHAALILSLAEETKRRPPVRKASSTSAKMTSKLARDIRAYARRHPRMNYVAMARVFNVSTGRISEALAGFRNKRVAAIKAFKGA